MRPLFQVLISCLPVAFSYIFITILAMLASTAEALPFTTSISHQDCYSGQVLLRDAKGKTQTFKTIESALKKANANSMITVGGPDLWRELVVIKNKRDLTVRGVCGAKVAGFLVRASENISIEGFQVQGASALQDDKDAVAADREGSDDDDEAGRDDKHHGSARRSCATPS